MRFAARTGWNTGESEIALRLRRRREAGLPLADLTASNPTRAGLRYDPGLLAPLADPRALDYDPQPAGLLEAREAVCRYYAGHGAAVEPAELILTTSTSEAYSFLFRLLLDPGGEIVVPQPGYPLFDYLAGLEDVRPVFAPLVYDHGWQIDAEGLRRAISPAARALVLVHPNNPTGHFTRPWEAAELARICRGHGLSLIVDEVFLDYGLGEPAASFAGGLEDVPVFVVSGLSKIAGLPQMKAAWIVARGPERARALERLEVIADTFLSMNAPVQRAIPRWLEGRGEIQRQILERVGSNLAALDRALVPAGAVRRLRVEGGWYAILRIPAVAPDEQTVLELIGEGVLVHPGYFFGMEDSGWLVISLLPPGPEFEAGISLLLEMIHRRHGAS